MWPWYFLHFHTWNIPHSNTSIMLLDFRFNILFFLIKYLVITSTEYDGSFCSEIRRQNRFAPDCVQFWDARGRKNLIEIFFRVEQHKKFIVFINVCVGNIHFFMMNNFVEFWCSNRLAAIKQGHADWWETWFSFLSRISLTRVSDNWAKLILLFAVFKGSFAWRPEWPMLFIFLIFIFQYIFTLIMITVINISIYFNVNVNYLPTKDASHKAILELNVTPKITWSSDSICAILPIVKEGDWWCIVQGDYHCIGLTRIKFYCTKVTPITNPAKVTDQGFCNCNSNAWGWHNSH